MIRPGAALLLGVLAAAPASADVIATPPDMCPEGSTVVGFCHGPPTCEIAECTGDADCGAGQVCRPRDLCVREHCCSGRGCGLPTATRYDHVASACGAGRTCADFDTACETRRVCVPGTPVADAGVDAGPPPSDAGTDGGAPGDDAGSGTDGGGTESDSGAPAQDSGTPAVDAAVPRRDAATGGDGGAAPVDAGGGGSTGGGCGCRSATSARAPAGLLLAVVAGALWRRRDRK